MAKRSAVVYGRRACLAVARRRPHEIERVLYQEDAPNRDLAPLLKACAAQRRPYRAVSASELERASKSAHHEGVLVMTRHRPPRSINDALDAWEPSEEQRPIWVALDRVDNDHNRGAIARSLAWFGGAGLIWESGGAPQLSGAALRVAQGSAEDIELLTVPSLPKALKQLQSHGVTILGAYQHEGETRSAFEKPSEDLTKGVCWVMGSERFGLSREVRACCDALITIPGSGLVESLNVSVSAGILITQSYAWLSSARS